MPNQNLAAPLRPPGCLWLAVHLPLLQLEVFRPRWLAPEAGLVSVVLEQKRVTALSAAAQAAGVRAGMRQGGVTMLASEALCFQRDRAREQAALHSVALSLLQYSPQVALAQDASVLLEVGASLRLFGGIRALLRRLRHTLALLGFTLATGCAPTAGAAWLLARHAAARRRRGLQVLQPHKLAARLDALPLNLLAAAAPCLELLHGIACCRLGELRRLPRPGLQRRCGQALLNELDQAYGRLAELHDWVVAAPEFKASMELPDRMEQADAILAYARSLLLQMTGWLSARRLAVGKIKLYLQHERGRQAIPASVLDIALAEAGWQEGHLLNLLKEKLGQVQLHAAVIGVTLEALDTVPLQARSASLFPEPGGQAQDHRRLLELLIARLGEGQVLRPAPQADHRPEVANRWLPVLDKAAAAPAGVTETPSATAPLRPGWLLPQAQPLEMRRHKPYYGSPLTLLTPAERIETGWWDPQAEARDYFVALDERHVQYWIYRERQPAQSKDEAQAESQAEPAWFLHGVFG